MSLLQPSPFLERVLRYLIPYFADVSADLSIARREALETLASYGARTRAELLCAIQIIILSFATLDTMAESNAPDMSPSMRLRYRGCANNINRNGQKTEQTLGKRLACDVPDVPPQNLIDDIPEDVAEEIMQQTQAMVKDYCDHAAANRAARPQPQEAPYKPIWEIGMTPPRPAMAMPVPPQPAPARQQAPPLS